MNFEDQIVHAMAEIHPGVRIHYVLAGQGPRTIVLLHGYPQTWWKWRHVIPMLVGAGYRVIAPDYRGAGDSTRPPDGYDKGTRASDIYDLLYAHAGLTEPVLLVRHDIGCMAFRTAGIGWRKSSPRRLCARC